MGQGRARARSHPPRRPLAVGPARPSRGPARTASVHTAGRKGRTHGPLALSSPAVLGVSDVWPHTVLHPVWPRKPPGWTPCGGQISWRSQPWREVALWVPSLGAVPAEFLQARALLSQDFRPPLCLGREEGGRVVLPSSPPPPSPSCSVQRSFWKSRSARAQARGGGSSHAALVLGPRWASRALSLTPGPAAAPRRGSVLTGPAANGRSFLVTEVSSWRGCPVSPGHSVSLPAARVCLP